ncbi:MAG: hypothetical protein MK212_17595 [Saprospiraceae bacterium]|nr:hypothetical protein [Saprospiraceae bacterium]
MAIIKKITEDNELYLYINGKLIYKRWLDAGYSKVFDVMAYDRYTYMSYTDLDVENSAYLIKVSAKIRLYTAAEGGRTEGVQRGYRPKHVFEYEKHGKPLGQFVGDIQFEESQLLELDKEYVVKVRFPINQIIEQFMEKGRKWWLYENSRKVGEGEILEFELPEGV